MLSLLTAITLAGATVIDRPALASQLSTTPVTVDYDAHGRVKLVRGKMGPLGNPVQFLVDRAAPLGLRADEKLQVLADQQESDGSRHVRVSRTLFGVPVELDQLRVHAGADGEVTSLEAETSALDDYTYAPPTVAPGRAISLASGNYQGRWEHPPRTDLVLVGDRLEGLTSTHLAWRVYVAFPPAPGQVPVIDNVYLDARDGHELGRLSQVYTAGGTPTTMSDLNLFNVQTSLNVTQNSTGVAMQDQVTLGASTGQLVVIDGSNNNSLYNTTNTSTTFGDKQAVSVSNFVTRATAFDLKTFKWANWNFNTTPSSAGGILVGITHVGTNMANAYFTTVTSSTTGQVTGTMNYGDGDGNILLDPAKCLDVSGHEIGHGIVTGTANLAYHNQSGALNEHFADVFGWMLDDTNDTMGEACTGPYFNGKPLRNMCHPALGGTAQPETMANYVSSPDTADGDHGGVHTNSGIPNKAACLFRDAVGSRAAGFAAVGSVWYRTLSQHLGPTASFADMVAATATSCTELSLGTTVCAALDTAWAGVGLAASTSGTGTCPPNSTDQGTTCTCNTGYHVNTAGTGCDPDATVTCPLHSHASGTYCYCDAGYTLNAAGDACVLSSSTAACGTHEHKVGSGCACDECYQYQSSKTGEGQTCVAVPNCAVCTDPLKTGTTGTCVCEAGTQPSGATCVGTLGTCGAENYAGRCSGSLLIYCLDQNSSGVPIDSSQWQIQELDCSQNATKTTCGLTSNGYDCVAPTNNCGTVPITGVCGANDTAQICDQGTVKSYDCGVNGCGTYSYQGTQVTFCNLCVPHATYDTTSMTCACDSGYVVTGTAPNQTCVASGGTGGGTGAGGGSGAGGGGSVVIGGNTGGGGGTSTAKSGCTTTNGELGFLALLGLLLIRRRR